MAVPARAAAQAAIVEAFLDGLWMERGLAGNTLAAYRSDLLAFTRWLDESGAPALLDVGRA
jgi:integrase/recombinase XerD